MIDGVGSHLARNLIAFCGSAKAVFTEKKNLLMKIPGIGSHTAENIYRFRDFESVDQEITFLEKHRIQPVYYLDADYPYRLKNCDDGPVILYYKGNTDLNNQRMISVVGTRKATLYGKQFTEELVTALQPYNVTILSGLASGIDTYAHKYAVKNGIPTIGVLGHGLHTIYPAANRQLAIEMLRHGGLLTEFRFNTPGAKENFPMRNRIVAGMSDAVIIVESSIKGGSLITAEMGNQYNRDVYALPGRLGELYSEGCNMLVHEHKAAIISSIDGLIRDLGYDLHQEKPQELQLFAHLTLSEPEQKVYDYLKSGERRIDEIHYHTLINMSSLSLVLLDLELKHLVKVLPGKTYRLVHPM